MLHESPKLEEGFKPSSVSRACVVSILSTCPLWRANEVVSMDQLQKALSWGRQGTPEEAGYFRRRVFPLPVLGVFPVPVGFTPPVPGQRVGFTPPVSGQRLPGAAEAGLVSPGEGRTRVTPCRCRPAHRPSLGLHPCEMGSDNGSLCVGMGCCRVEARPTHTVPLKSSALGLEREAELSG